MAVFVRRTTRSTPRSRSDASTPGLPRPTCKRPGPNRLDPCPPTEGDDLRVRRSNQSYSVRTDTPRSAANCAWVRPAFSRARTMAYESTVKRRPARPTLISRIPWRISRPIFLVFSHFAIVDRLFHLPEHVRGNVLLRVLSIERKHPDLARLSAQVVDHSQPAALPPTGHTPTKLSHATSVD